jgi:hypothetical protein
MAYLINTKSVRTKMLRQDLYDTGYRIVVPCIDKVVTWRQINSIVSVAMHHDCSYQ